MLSDGHARALQAKTALGDCRLCPRDCRADRTRGAAGAFCRLGPEAWVYKELLSLGEERAISPTLLVDLSGCSLRCLFCSEWQHVVDPQGHGAVPLRADWLAERMAKRRGQGARTVSFVGGDPTPSLPAVLGALAECPEPLPVVWNCNAMLSDQALGLLQGAVATWVLDAKFGQLACAKTLAGIVGFDADAELDRALAAALATAPTPGLPRAIVRHLLMPGHLDCCTEPVLRRLARRLQDAPGDVLINVMTTFVPSGPGAGGLRRAPELARWNRLEEVARAVNLGRQWLGPRLLVDGAP